MRSVRPFIFRTTFHWLGASTVTDKVLPSRAGCSLPSTTTVSTYPGAKVKTYLFAPAASIVISSLSLLLEGLTFHLPMKGSFAAHNVPVARKIISSNRNALFSMESPVNPIRCRQCSGKILQHLRHSFEFTL